MAHDRSRPRKRGLEDMRARNDPPVRYRAELSHERPLDDQCRMELIDEPLEQNWTAPQPELANQTSGEAIGDTDSNVSPPLDLPINGDMIPGSLSAAHMQPLSFNANNWNDIPDEMFKPISRATAFQRLKARKRRINRKPNIMPESRQSSVESRDNMQTSEVVGFPDLEHLYEAAHSNREQPYAPGKATLHCVTKIKSDPYMQKFKLKRSIGSDTHVANSNIEEFATTPPEIAKDHDEHENEYEWSDNSDIEDIEFDDIVSPGSTSESMSRVEFEANITSTLKMMSIGIDESNSDAGFEHKTTKVDEADSSTHTHLTDDEFDEYCYNYLEAKKAAGEPPILPKDMSDRLRALVKAAEEQRREKDPHYQHALLMAKVNAAEARREAGIPREALYPESARGEKCTLEEEDWDLLDELEMKAQSDDESELGLGITSRSEGEMDGDVVASSQPGKAAQSVPKGSSTGKLGKMYGWASKAGSVFNTKKGPKDRRQAGWTLADLLEEDRRRARR